MVVIRFGARGVCVTCARAEAARGAAAKQTHAHTHTYVLNASPANLCNLGAKQNRRKKLKCSPSGTAQKPPRKRPPLGSIAQNKSQFAVKLITQEPCRHWVSARPTPIANTSNTATRWVAAATAAAGATADPIKQCSSFLTHTRAHTEYKQFSTRRWANRQNGLKLN